MAKEEFPNKPIFQLQRKNPLNTDDNILSKDWQSETKTSFPLIKSAEEEIGKFLYNI